jgi:hypothetical protein
MANIDIDDTASRLLAMMTKLEELSRFKWSTRDTALLASAKELLVEALEDRKTVRAHADCLEQEPRESEARIAHWNEMTAASKARAEELERLAQKIEQAQQLPPNTTVHQ